MAKLFSECESGNCPNQGELDGYLSLKRSKKGGQTFSQMSLSQKFGMGQGEGFGQGQGTGLNGSSGFAIGGRPQIGLLGNERKAQQGQASSRQSARGGKGAGAGQGPGDGPEHAKADIVKGLKPINRQSGAVAADTVSEEYSDLVDSYFKAITTKQKP